MPLSTHDEELYEEDVVFDQSGLLNSRQKKKTAVVRMSSGKCMLFAKTAALCGAFFVLGLCIAIPGPTLLEFQQQVNTDVTHISYIFTARALGYLSGSLVGGVLFDRFNRQFLVFLSLLGTAVAVCVAPWCRVLWLLEACMVIMGLTMGFLDTGGNVLCLDLWGRNSGPFMQAMHFSFGFGAFVAPLLAQPFLGPVEPAALLLDGNNSFSTPNLAGYTWHMPNVYGSDVDHDVVKRNTEMMFRRDIDAVLNGTIPPFVNGSEVTTLTLVPIVNSTVLPLPTVKTPKPKPTFTDARKLDSSKDWEKVPIVHPPVQAEPAATSLAPASTVAQSASANLTLNNTNSTNVDDSLPVNIPDTAFDQSNGTEIPEEMSERNVDADASLNDTDVPEVSEVELKTDGPTDGNPLMETVAPASPLEPTIAVPVTVKSPATVPEKPAPTVSSTVPIPFEDDYEEPSAGLSGDQYADEHVQDPSDIFGPRRKDQEKHSAQPMKISDLKLATSTENPAPEITTKHQHVYKPISFDNDTEDSGKNFIAMIARKVEAYGLSRFQIAYFIIGVLVFLVSLTFLGFLCYSPRDPRSKQEDGAGVKKTENRCFKMALVGLLGFFFFLYVGMEVAYGQLLLTFAVKSGLHLTKSTASYITATFWGSFAAMRFAAIFCASGLSPTAMLIFDFIMCTVGSVILAVAGGTQETALWVGSAFVGVGMASVFPTGILWSERYIHVSNKVAAVFVIGAAFGEMACPFTVGQFIDNHPMMLMYALVVANALCIITFIAMWLLATRHGEKYLMPSDAGYQLASQHDDDDVMEMAHPIEQPNHLYLANNMAVANGNLH